MGGEAPVTLVFSTVSCPPPLLTLKVALLLLLAVLPLT